MKRIKYILIFSISLVFILTSCTDKNEDAEIQAGTTPINLSGMSLRNDGVNGDNLYLKAFTSGPLDVYLGETQIEFASDLSTTPQDVIFPGAIPYYPLGGGTINIFAYSGKLYDSDKMVVLAGNGSAYDAVLSNQGEQAGVPGLSPEGTGTPGSSSAQATVLHFRHVMTQLIVNVEVNANETSDPVSPPPASIRFTMEDVAARGLYPIRGAAPVPGSEAAYADAAYNTSGNYTITLGTNYLVPNGENLAGKQLTSLVIDDYVATAADLQNFTITAEDPGNPDLWLVPGYSYNLTFTVNRLGVTGAQIRQIPWQTHELSGNDVNYEAYPLNIDLGPSYANTGEDAISKVILHTGDNKIYVGESLTSGTNIPFVTLPAGNVVRADLYTNKGLLLSIPITTEYQYANNAGTLNIQNLSVAGMLPETPGNAYDPVTNPYLITTPLQFLNINKDLTASYKQGVVVDLDLINAPTFNGFGGFSGTYDGNGLWISAFNVQSGGLFASNSGTLRNIRIFSGYIDAAGQSTAGGICANNIGTIVGCFNSAIIVNAPAIAGGITGTNSGQLIANLNTGNILSGTSVGGICGNNTNTAEGAISANINTGSLYEGAGALGGICGTSTASANNVVRTSFWLVGTAAKSIGGVENPIGSGAAGTFDSSALDPPKLRNGLDPGETEDRRILNRLNNEMTLHTPWNQEYQYILDRVQTGSTWPVPVIR